MCVDLLAFGEFFLANLVITRNKLTQTNNCDAAQLSLVEPDNARIIGTILTR